MIYWKRRPMGEFRLFAQTLSALALTRLALYCAPLTVVRRRLCSTLRAGRPLPPGCRLPMTRILRCTAAAAKLMPVGATCLAQALVIQALLQRHGYSTQLKIGVRRPQSGPFAAHAWLEHEGATVVGGPEAVTLQYQPLPEVEQLIS